MDIFKSLDPKLEAFAVSHNGKFCGKDFLDSPPTDEKKRMIIWTEAGFEKIIFISPAAFAKSGWDFLIDASVDDNTVAGEIPFWQKYLLEGAAVSEIERQIETLFAEAEDLLSAVTVEDMRPDWTYVDGKLADR